MRGFRKATSKLFIGHKLDDLAQLSPATDQSIDNVPNLVLPHRYDVEPIAHAIISPLEPDYIHRPVTVQGVPLSPHPLQDLVDLAATSGAGNPHVAGTLTATYPEEFRKDLGRDVCVRYPNGDGWFNVIGTGCAFGATVDGAGGDGDDAAWLAGHLTLAVALRMMRECIPHVDSTRGTLHLMHDILHAAHRDILQLDVQGSAAVFLHACFHVTGDRYVFVFAVTGDAEAMWFDSSRGEWRYLVEPIGLEAQTLRVNASQMPGAVGKNAADEKGALKGNTNLQYGAVACRAADIFLLASDGVWDTLDAVQNGVPRQFGLSYDSWSQLSDADVRRFVRMVPIFKQRRLNDITREAVKAGPQAVVDAVVKHAWDSTAGERELFQIVDIESRGQSSIYQDHIVAKGQVDSLYSEAKEASLAAGQMIFAKPDHVGVQAFSPAGIAPVK